MESRMVSCRRKALQGFVLVAAPNSCCAEDKALQDVSAKVASSDVSSDEDVYYPRWFVGNWEATTELFALDFPQGEEAAGQAARQRSVIGTAKAVEQYPQRYMEYEKKIIADRAFNMRGFVRGSGGGPRAFEEVEWEPSSPNYTKVTIKRDGVSIQTETRIARRSVAVPEGREDLFNASEVYQQIVTAPGTSSRPSQEKVTPVRCVNKFKRVSDSEIEVLQRVEVFPRVDPLMGPVGVADSQKPVAIYKYRGVLKKSLGIDAAEPKIRAL